MTDNTTPSSQPRRRRGRLVAVAAAAAVTVLAVALIGPQLTPQPTQTPSGTLTPTIAGTTGPVQSSPVPSDAVSPTIQVVPGSTPASQTATSSTTPREQPTENEDSAPRETQDPIEITAVATPKKGIEASLVRIESVTGEVAIPGEVGGPALRITLEVMNNTPDDFDTPAVVVNLYKGAVRSPAGSLLNPGSRAFPDKIAPRASAEGIYLFTLGPDDREDVTIEVDLAVGTPIVLFQGKVK